MLRFIQQDVALFSSIQPIKYKYLDLYVELSVFFSFSLCFDVILPQQVRSFAASWFSRQNWIIPHGVFPSQGSNLEKGIDS